MSLVGRILSTGALPLKFELLIECLSSDYTFSRFIGAVSSIQYISHLRVFKMFEIFSEEIVGVLASVSKYFTINTT